jgi:hypothetical protein
VKTEKAYRDEDTDRDAESMGGKRNGTDGHERTERGKTQKTDTIETKRSCRAERSNKQLPPNVLLTFL